MSIKISLVRHARPYAKCYKRSLEERTIANSFCIEKKRINLKWDGHCDSPGHNAKYSLFDQSLTKVIAVSLTQVTEVEGASNRTEKAGLIKVKYQKISKNTLENRKRVSIVNLMSGISANL